MQTKNKVRKIKTNHVHTDKIIERRNKILEITDTTLKLKEKEDNGYYFENYVLTFKKKK